jgi:hypothetical protein
VSPVYNYGPLAQSAASKRIAALAAQQAAILDKLSKQP